MIALLLLAEIHCVPPLLGQKFGPSVDESKKALHTRARGVQRVSLPLWRRGRGERPRPRPSVRAPHRRGAAVPHTALSSRCVCSCSIPCIAEPITSVCIGLERADGPGSLYVMFSTLKKCLLKACCWCCAVLYYITLLFALYWAAAAAGAAAASTLDRVLTRATRARLSDPHGKEWGGAGWKAATGRGGGGSELGVARLVRGLIQQACGKARTYPGVRTSGKDTIPSVPTSGLCSLLTNKQTHAKVCVGGACVLVSTHGRPKAFDQLILAGGKTNARGSSVNGYEGGKGCDGPA